jgi:hypothetical protein
MILISDLSYKSYIFRPRSISVDLLMILQKNDKYTVSASVSSIYSGWAIDIIKSDTFKTLTHELLILYQDGSISNRSFIYNSYDSGKQYTKEYIRHDH